MTFKNVEVKKKASVYHDGRVTSRTVTTLTGQRKTLGIMLPGRYRFTPDEPERMDVTQGRCRVRIAGGSASEYIAGASFTVPPKKEYEIEVLELLDYVCHFG